MRRILPWMALLLALASLVVPAMRSLTPFLAISTIILFVVHFVRVIFFRPGSECHGLPLIRVIGRNYVMGTGYWVYSNKDVYSENDFFIIFMDGSKVETAFGLKVVHAGGYPLYVVDEYGHQVFPRN